MSESTVDLIEVGRLEDIEPGKRMYFRAANRGLVIFNIDGTIYAIDEKCAHQGSSLFPGRLQGKVLTCPSHGFRYDVTTGCLAGTKNPGVASHPVTIIDGKVFVAVPAPTTPPSKETGGKMAKADKATASNGSSTGPWNDNAIDRILEWEPAWGEKFKAMSEEPWTNGVLPRKEIELISLAVNAACTNQSEDGTRRHIRGALDAGASRDEVMMIIKIASLLSIHTASLGAPILLEEAKAAGVKLTPKKAATPVCSGMQAAGQWNNAWDEFFEIDPAWTEAIIAASLPIYISGVLTPKLAELLSIAVDASITHMYAPGTRRHIQTALKLGATVEEIMEVLKICVSAGMQASNLSVPILAEELERFEQKENP